MSEAQQSGDSALAEVTADFVQRMEQAAVSLDALAERLHDAPREYGRRMERARLRGKAEGMRLAISYWRDAERFASPVTDSRTQEGST